MARTLIVSDRHNSFFSANNIRVGNQIPTEGNYVKGDIIVNIGETTATEAMWICVESGNPGVWEVVGAGVGGGSLVSINDSVFVNGPVNEVSLAGLGVGVSSKDKLTVHYNSVHLMEGVDYKIEENKIVKLTEGNWNENSEENALFAFELLKCVESIDGDKIVVDSKLSSITNHVVIENACSEVEIGIEEFNSGNDTMLVFKNGVNMAEGIDYEVQGGKIVSTGEVWNENGIADYGMTFIVLKEVVKYTGDMNTGVIEMEHLSNDVKNAIEAAGNIDLSGYQGKNDDNLATTDKTIVGAINELFQNANNGKELIASAIGEPLNAEDTFSAMSNDINGLLSTFKTNMMNAGVVVESGDKFKNLINKIKGLTEGEGNKGIQYINESIDLKLTQNDALNGTFTTMIELDFVPMVVFIETEEYDGEYISFNSNYHNIIANDYGNDRYAVINTTSNGKQIYMSVRINGNNIELDYRTSFSPLNYTLPITYYAIGVGEEDTTLRDSLASILQEEGVEVTEEDDMASLISKIELIRTLDNKFPDWYTPPSDGVWLEGPTVEYDHREGDITSYGDNLYITSGFNGAYPKKFYCFNIKNGVMATKAQLPAVRFGNSIDCVGDMLYCIGGATYSNYWYTAQNTIYCYDPKTNSWTTKSGTLPEIRFGHTSAVVGSTIYILGGSGSGSHTGDGTSPDNSMIYDVLTDTCTTFTSQADNLYSSAVVLDNKIYVFGGGYYSNTSCGLLVYDLTSKTWTNRYLDIYRSGSELLEYNGELYIYNGCSDEYNYAHLYKLNLDDLTLTPLTEPLTADYGGSAIAIDDKIYAFGGYANSTADKGGIGYRNTVRVFIF